jgi:hypothetical protein
VKALNKSGKPSLKISNEYIRSKPDITEDQRLLFLLEAAIESDSKLFAEVIENKKKIKELVDRETFVKKITNATNATVVKAVEYEVPSLLDEAIEAYKETVGNDKLSILKMKRYYHENTGGRSELLDLSKKQFKEVKKDEAELGKLLLELKQYEKNGQFQELIEEANKHLVKLNNNDINIVNYCKFLVSLEKTDQAIEILEKRRRELEKKEVKSVSLDRFLKYLQSK